MEFEASKAKVCKMTRRGSKVSSSLEGEENIEDLRKTATFAGFSHNPCNFDDNYELIARNFQSYRVDTVDPLESPKIQPVSEVFEAEYSMLSDRAEAESDDIFHRRTNPAYQTFQKPHHSENDKFWSKITLNAHKNSPNGKEDSNPQQSVATTFDQTPVRIVDDSTNNQEQSANIFIIKSQNKSGAKRVAKMNRILALEPFDLHTSRNHTESFFSSEQRCQTTRHHSQKTVESELPSKSQWIFSPQNLQKIPQDEIQLRQQSSSRNITIQEEYLLSGSNNDDLCSHAKRKEQKHSLKSNFIKLNPQMVKKLKIQIKTETKSPKITASSSSTTTDRSKVQHVDASLPKTEIALKARPLTTQITTKPHELHLILNDQRSTPQSKTTKGTPNITIRKFEAVFGSPVDRSNTETVGNNCFLVGRIVSNPGQQPIRAIPSITSTHSASSTKRKLYIQSAIPSSEINLESSLSFKTASERSSTENCKTGSHNSLETTATMLSSDARGRKKSSSMSKGQAKVLNKIFNFDN